jgi:GTP cyclohydrolase I
MAKRTAPLFHFPPEALAREFLSRFVPDIDREGLQETPARFLAAFNEWTSGYRVEDPGSLLKTFEDGAAGVDEMILQKGIPVYSLCEHHLAPFFGVAHVAYIPDGKIVGLSKVGRVVEAFARRLQVQERLTKQIADCLWTGLQPDNMEDSRFGVAVVLRCRHYCMESRGINRANIETTTSSLYGTFREDSRARAELFSLIGG